MSRWTGWRRTFSEMAGSVLCLQREIQSRFIKKNEVHRINNYSFVALFPLLLMQQQSHAHSLILLERIASIS